MFRLTTDDGKILSFKFHHIQKQVAHSKGEKWPKEHRGKKAVTFCRVAEFVDDKRNDLTLSAAECSKKDTFIKKLGRRIALGRALKDIGASPELEKRVWEEYENALDRAALQSYRNLNKDRYNKEN